jgi:hypothetical protein
MKGREQEAVQRTANRDPKQLERNEGQADTALLLNLAESGESLESLEPENENRYSF